jgi:hypothetical protein
MKSTLTHQERKAVKDEIRERLHAFRSMPETQQRKYEDLFADELVGSVLAVIEQEGPRVH